THVAILVRVEKVAFARALHADPKLQAPLQELEQKRLVEAERAEVVERRYTKAPVAHLQGGVAEILVHIVAWPHGHERNRQVVRATLPGEPGRNEIGVPHTRPDREDRDGDCCAPELSHA